MTHDPISVMGQYIVCDCGWDGLGYVAFAEHMKEDKK